MKRQYCLSIRSATSRPRTRLGDHHAPWGILPPRLTIHSALPCKHRGVALATRRDHDCLFFRLDPFPPTRGGEEACLDTAHHSSYVRVRNNSPTRFNDLIRLSLASIHHMQMGGNTWGIMKTGTPGHLCSSGRPPSRPRPLCRPTNGQKKKKKEQNVQKVARIEEICSPPQDARGLRCASVVFLPPIFSRSPVSRAWYRTMCFDIRNR